MSAYESAFASFCNSHDRREGSRLGIHKVCVESFDVETGSSGGRLSQKRKNGSCKHDSPSVSSEELSWTDGTRGQNSLPWSASPQEAWHHRLQECCLKIWHFHVVTIWILLISALTKLNTIYAPESPILEDLIRTSHPEEYWPPPSRIHDSRMRVALESGALFLLAHLERNLIKDHDSHNGGVAR